MGMNHDPHSIAMMLIGKKAGGSDAPEGDADTAEGPEEGTSDKKVAMHEFMTAVHGHDADSALDSFGSLLSLMHGGDDTGDDGE